MKRAEPLPFNVLSKMPRCQAQRIIHYLGDNEDTDRQCAHRSKYRVGKRYYCMRHAEIAALHLLMFESEPYDPAGPLCVWPRDRTD